MHLIEPVRSCLDDILQSTGEGMKSMVLDEFTTGVISMGYSRSEMLLREVYLFEQIDTIFESSERLNHMKCIVLLRPTKENIELLCRELNRPHYRTYHLYFTNRIGQTTVKMVAEADAAEVVRCIKELPLDYQPVNPFLFSCKLFNRTFDLKNNGWLPDGLKKSSQCLVSALIALQVYPLIRYQSQSELCKTLAERVDTMMKNEMMANKTLRQAAPFDVNSLLIIVDRRRDLVTPLLNTWTYYSMINEQFGIKNDRVNLIDVPDRKPQDPKEMLISIENDQFFGDNYFKNYGELGSVLKNAIERLKDETKVKHKVESLEDMKRFIDEYPETRRQASNIHNHVFLMSELSRLVTDNSLLNLSECEQELACKITTPSEMKNLRQWVGSNMIRPIDAVRLVSLYAVCRQEKSNLSDLIKVLKVRGDVEAKHLKFIEQLRSFYMSKPQSPIDETVQQVTRMIVQGVKGVESTLNQHRPNIVKVLDEILKGNKLKETEFCFQGERYRQEPPKRIVIFFVGGITYAEALSIDQINRSQPSNVQIVAGGTSTHNFISFMDEVRQAIIMKESK